MIRAIIFDCFGVLIGRGFDETYRKAGGDPEADRKYIQDLMGQNNLGLITEEEFNRTIAQKLGVSLDAWYSAVKRAEQVNDELLRYIEALHARFKTAVLSNANRGVVEQRIGFGATRHFDAIIASAEVGLIKPDPQIFAYAAEQLNVQLEECVFVDDKADFADAARAAGMQGVHYRDFEQMQRDLEGLL